jgi:hypothetical protein
MKPKIGEWWMFYETCLWLVFPTQDLGDKVTARYVYLATEGKARAGIGNFLTHPSWNRKWCRIEDMPAFILELRLKGNPIG